MEVTNSKKVSLVAGGAGFIGSHLCLRLLKEGRRVICIDNLQTGNMANIQPLMTDPSFRFVEYDVTQPYTSPIAIDEIYNLACPASPVHYQNTPIETTLTSVLGARNLLDLALIHHCTYLQASTSEVYGDAMIHPQPETYWGNVNPIGIRSCYDEGKRCAESLCMDYNRCNKLPVKIIRIFNTYGPNMAANDGRVVSNFIVQALQGKDIRIYGDGSQTRCFQYVDDLIEGILKMMHTEASFTGPVNLGNPQELSIGQLAETIIRLTNSSSKITHHALPVDDPRHRNPDISLAMDSLHWRPMVGTEEGLRKTVDYFQNQISTAIKINSL